MRNQRELRYLVTPGNVVVSALSLVRRARQEPAGPLLAVGTDARPGPTWPAPQQAPWPAGATLATAGPQPQRGALGVRGPAEHRGAAPAPGQPATPATRPRAVVLVVGETARAANWGLSGYARPTTPELAALPVINFAGVSSCGTDTESSLPCMFAAVGRRQYDERRIHRSENLLHVAARAGVGVHWRDNQSGCKGVCDGFAQDTVAALAPALCSDGHCLDEGLLHDLPALLRGTGAAHAPPPPAPGAAGAAASAASPVRLVVLHQIGNHGPAYHRRVPPGARHFQPACKSDDLRQCSIEGIVNAYDNALRYTDHVLATLIRQLQAQEIDSAVLYVSDHGESLGEHGLFLHGMPYAIAPAVQRQVPMVMWVSPGFAAARGLDLSCLAARAGRAGHSHDQLFHTVLGLLDVQTSAREAPLDLTDGCVRPRATALAPHAG
ncbi:MAG: sulfatase-like hydrolase/transferase [Rubrivivax sp.]|nr:sulfatase-like hydrolase/transferase [Rubrivivax sp.]